MLLSDMKPSMMKFITQENENSEVLPPCGILKHKVIFR
jgi:hypothetical protein